MAPGAERPIGDFSLDPRNTGIENEWFDRRTRDRRPADRPRCRFVPAERGTADHAARGVFSTGGRELEVCNVNRSAVEHALGVDPLYLHEECDAWTMVQYKIHGARG